MIGIKDFLSILTDEAIMRHIWMWELEGGFKNCIRVHYAKKEYRRRQKLKKKQKKQKK